MVATLKILLPSRSVRGAAVVLLKTKWFLYSGGSTGKLTRICTANFNLVDEIIDLEDGDGPQWRAMEMDSPPITRALAEELGKRQDGKVIDLTEIDKPLGRCRVVIDTARSGTYRLIGGTDADHCASLQQLKKNSCDDDVWDDARENSGLLNVYGFIFSCLYPNETISFSTNSDVSHPFITNK